MRAAIAGAGLIGRLLGWRLKQAGWQVDLFEQSSKLNPASAAHAAASMLAPLSEFPDSSLALFELGRKSLVSWPSILNELSVPYGIEGSIVVSHSQDFPLVRKFERTLTQAGLPGVRSLSKSDLLNLEPELADRFESALFLEGEGWLDNRALLDALENKCGTITYDEYVEPESLMADLIVDCRGSGSDDMNLRGVRGEVIRLRATEVKLRRPIRLMHPRYQIYISPRSNGEYVIGATEIESESRKAMTVRSGLELLSAAHTVHPGFAEAEILELGVGVRAAYPDNEPRLQWRDQVLSINGLYRHGFLIAPAILDAALEEIEESWKSSLTAMS